MFTWKLKNIIWLHMTTAIFCKKDKILSGFNISGSAVIVEHINGIYFLYIWKFCWDVVLRRNDQNLKRSLFFCIKTIKISAQEGWRLHPFLWKYFLQNFPLPSYFVFAEFWGSHAFSCLSLIGNVLKSLKKYAVFVSYTD